MNTNALKMLQQLRRVVNNPKEDVSCHIRWLMNAMDQYIEDENKKSENDVNAKQSQNFISLPYTDPENPNIWARKSLVMDVDETRINTSVYQEMENVNDILKSFSYHHYLQKPRALADTGFFYSGDCIRCFHCGLELRNWTDDDAKEHYRYSPSCDYQFRINGWEYVNEVMNRA